MDAYRVLYALRLVANDLGKLVTIPDRMHLLSEKWATYDPVTSKVTITDKGRDKIARKGK